MTIDLGRRDSVLYQSGDETVPMSPDARFRGFKRWISDMDLLQLCEPDTICDVELWHGECDIAESCCQI